MIVMKIMNETMMVEMMIDHYIYLLMHHLITLFTPRGSNSPYSKLPVSNSNSSIGHHPDESKQKQ